MTNLKKGNILIADPSIINDNQFNRSAIIITSSSIENEVVGLIINKKLNYNLQDVVPEIKLHFDVFDGGPVNKDNLYFIHNNSKLIPNSIKLRENLYWSGDFKSVIELINSEIINSDNIKFCLGYTGWSARQLIDEIKNENWLKCKAITNQEVFSNMNSYWKSKMVELGGEYSIWSNTPNDHLHN